MREKDIQGLSYEQIQEKWAMPYRPQEKARVKILSHVDLCEGPAPDSCPEKNHNRSLKDTGHRLIVPYIAMRLHLELKNTLIGLNGYAYTSSREYIRSKTRNFKY